MNSLKKTLKVTALIVVVLLIGISVYLYNSGPDLPEKTDEIIESVLNNPLPEIITGETGYT